MTDQSPPRKSNTLPEKNISPRAPSNVSSPPMSSIFSTPPKSPGPQKVKFLTQSRATELRKRESEYTNPNPLPSPSPSQPPRLTFGVELEFNIAYLLPSGRIFRDAYLAEGLPYTTDPDPEDPRVVRGLATYELDPEEEPTPWQQVEAYREQQGLPYTTDPDPEDPRVVRGLATYELDPEEEPTPWQQVEAYREQREQIYTHIRDTLREAGLPCRLGDDYSNPKPEDWVLFSDRSVGPVEDDDSAHNYNFMDVEITSPPFYDHEDSRRQVKAVCEILTSTYRIHAKGNKTCGMHVHVSSRVPFDQFSTKTQEEFPYGYSGYHPRHLASLMACLWVFEDRLQRIHPEHRRPGHEAAEYCLPLATGSWLTYDCDFPRGGWRQRGLKTLLAARDEKTCQEVCFLTRGFQERLSYNTRTLSWDKGIRTVEFRQHEGTVEAEEVSQWIKVCIALVKFAVKVDEKALDGFLKRHVDDALEDYTAIDLLKAIGSADSAEYYEKKMRERDAVEEE
ncbi:hypothetical protein HYFRA_00003101 [Hymenoscyphus fraxineus]|uniref:Amidoligase enzyme n=1 Tax=Hymenoscyphus fraxineus TaxID=746836 RepID=A0A9N9PFU9_9HELO|nr:hypothetical protein HYFRA_00003101 [Hymenoscyphus fraxineus]